MKGFAAWVLWGIVHIYMLIGFRNRLVVFTNWMWQWLTYARGARLITASAARSQRTAEQEAAPTAGVRGLATGHSFTGQRLSESELVDEASEESFPASDPPAY